MAKTKTLINDMSQGPVLSSLTRFALPIMLSNVLQAVYSMVDMMVVGQFVGAAGLSAVGIGGQLQFLFLAVGMGFATGGQIVISQQVGSKSENISKTIGTLLTTELILAILVGVFGIAFHKPLLTLMNTPAEAMADAVGYMVICSLGMIFIFGYNALCSILRGMGESKLPMLFIAIASIVNVVLDLLFVAVFHWSAAGAAAATVIAQAVAFAFALVCLIRNKDAVGFDFKLKSFKPDKAQLIALCKLGIPQVLQQFLITGSITFINAQINAYGLAASAVDSVGGKLNTVANIVSGSFCAATATMVAHSFGARKMERVKQAHWACMAICMIWWLALSVCYLLLPKQIFGLFTSDPQVLDMAPKYLCYAVIWLMAMCSMCGPYSVVEGLGYASFNLVVGLIDGVVARIGLSILLGYFMGLPGYWLGSGLAGFVTTIVMGAYFLSGRWKTRELITH